MNRGLTSLVVPLALCAAGATFWVFSQGGSVRNAAAFADASDQLLGSPQAGRLATVSVAVGQHVAAGERIAQLDTTLLQLRLEQARSAVAGAEAELVAQESLQLADLARTELRFVALRATQSRDKAELAEVARQRERLEKLAGEKLVGATEVEESRRREAALQAGVQARGSLAAPAPLARELSRRLGPYQEAVNGRRLELQRAERELEEAVVIAPGEGVVAELLHRPGEILGANTPVVRLTIAVPGRVLAWVPERQAALLVPGRRVELRGAEPFATPQVAEVVEVVPLVEEFPVRARLSPQLPAWGRRAVLKVVDGRPLVPGEAFHVRF